MTTYSQSDLATRVHELRQLLHYCEATGVFTWRVSRKRVRAGDTTGVRLNSHGYKRIKIDGVLYLAHRLAWLYVHGAWPSEQIDHINGDRADNRISNLRLANNRQNQQNQKLRINNASGFKGASWNARRRKWIAQISVEGRKTYLGAFETAHEAHAAYAAKAAAKFHEFARAA